MRIFTTSVTDTYMEPLRRATAPNVPACFSQRVYRQNLNGVRDVNSIAQLSGQDVGQATLFLQNQVASNPKDWLTCEFNNVGKAIPPIASQIGAIAVPAQDLQEIPRPWLVKAAVLSPTEGPDYVLTPFFSGCAFGIFEHDNTVCVVHVKPAKGAPGSGVGTSDTLAALLAGQCPPGGSTPYLRVTAGASSTLIDGSALRVVLARTGSALASGQSHRTYKQFNYQLASVIGARGADKKWRFYAQEMTGTIPDPSPPRDVHFLYPI